MITGKRLALLREEKGYKSQRQLAEAIGINPNTYAKYESGERDISPEWLLKFADFFNASTDYILGISDYRGSHKELNEPLIKRGGVSISRAQFINQVEQLSDDNRDAIYKVVSSMIKKD